LGIERIEKLKGIFLVKEDDQILIKKALAGNESAYRVLLNRHKEAIYRLIIKIVRNQEEARDLVQ
jgi:RNA polymerase sigma-70 factor (ECF subfamily)